MDSLKNDAKNSKTENISFNPNFITDYKGYKLEMSVQEIDRLLALEKNK
jgi:hypothetical protein